MTNVISKLIRKQQISRWFNITLFKTVGGRRFKVPAFFKMGTGNYFMTELWMVDVLQRLLPGRPGAFVDIGANIGQTLIKLRSVSPDMEYIGIEPNPVCVFYLHELIRQNRFENCRVIPAGIFARADLLELTFLYDDDADSSATLLAEADVEPDKIQRQFVPVLPFSIIRQQLGLDSICLVKIDVEGAELEVLQSLASTLDDLRPLLLLEILPVFSDENIKQRERQNSTQELLASHGYSLARICKTRDGQFLGLKPIQTIGIHSDLTLSDYLAFPHDMQDFINSKFTMV